jgi:hypothetical protein
MDTIIDNQNEMLTLLRRLVATNNLEMQDDFSIQTMHTISEIERFEEKLAETDLKKKLVSCLHSR